MGYVIPTGYSRVSFNYSATNATGSAPSWGFGTDRSPDLDVLEGLYNWWDDSLRPLTNAGAHLIDIEMRNDLAALSYAVELNGSRGGSYAPPQVAGLVKLSSPAVGRANRGRIFWPYLIQDGEIDGGGLIDAGLVGDMQTAVNDLVAYLDTMDMRLVILHSVEGTPSPVLSATAQAQAATIRRRNRR